MSNDPSLPTAAATTQPKSLSVTIKEALEVLGKIVIGLAGLCYVLGLIVVTVHLRRFSLNSLDLPQLHYVTAGVWAIMPILLTLILIIFILYVYESESGLAPARSERVMVWKRVTGLLYPLAAFSVLFYAVFGFFGSRFGLNFTWNSWVFIPLLGTGAAFLIVSPIFLFTRSPEYSQGRSVFLILGAMAVGIVLGLLYLMVFASNTYQTIPWSTGGGRPSRVQLVINSAEQPYAAAAGINFSSVANRTESLSLLLTTEREYVVINLYGTAVSIPSDSVKGVIYEK